MKTDGMIDVTDAPLEAIVRAAYNPSRPQGLGHLHFQPGDLTDEEVARIINTTGGPSIVALSMDYVKGRACKMTVFQNDGRRYIQNRWHDHSDGQLRQFLETIGIDPSAIEAARSKGAA